MPSTDAIQAKPLVLFLLVVAVMFPLRGASQPADATLSGLIGSIKAQKEAALDPGKSASPHPNTKPKLLPPKTPIVWSIFGLNQMFTAVVVIEGKTRVLRSIDLPYRVAGWRVLSMDATGVLVQGYGRRLLLPAPNLETRPEVYLHELGVAAASPGLDTTDTGILSLPLPLPTKPSLGLSPAQVKASGLPRTNSNILEKR
jgi:hypothetical protein